MTQFNSKRLFGLKNPIVQAPMAGVSTPELAAAVSNAGGLGSISIGASSLAEAKAMIERTRTLTANPFNVNVFCHHPAKHDAEIENSWISYLQPLFSEFGAAAPKDLREIYDSFLDSPDIFRMILEQRPSFVSFHFGLPSLEWIAALRQAGIKTLATATNLDEARLIASSGIDGIIAQGIEAGGHRGIFEVEAADEKLPTISLVKSLAEHSPMPIIAAGGIMNGQGINDALSAGAAGAQLGTAFILCPESAANQAYRQSLRNAPAGSTRLTSVISGRPARGIVNRLITHGEAKGAPKPASYPLAYDIAKALNALALKQGHFDFSAFWSGEGLALARELPAKELVEVLLHEMKL